MRELSVRGEDSPQKLRMGLQLKKIPYPTFDGKPAFVVYAISDNQCIFSGITWPATSTINAAEGVVEAIAKNERRKVHSLRFFDLQTQRGYPGKEVGEFEFDELTLKLQGDRIADVSWNPRECPPEIQGLFIPYIQGPVDAEELPSEILR